MIEVTKLNVAKISVNFHFRSSGAFSLYIIYLLLKLYQCKKLLSIYIIIPNKFVFNNKT